MTDSTEHKAETPSEIMFFTVNLSDMIEGELSIPTNADEKWATICNPKEFVTFSNFIRHLDDCNNPKLLLDALNPDSPKLDHLSIELSRYLNYMHHIIPTQQFLDFTGQMRLEPDLFYEILNADQLSLLSCALTIFKKILEKIPDNQDRQSALRSFGDYLVPYDLLQQRKTRPYIKTILFLPLKVIENGHNYWISVSRDRQEFNLYSFDNNDEPIITRTTKDFIPKICGDELIFSPKEDDQKPVEKIEANEEENNSQEASNTQEVKSEEEQKEDEAKEDEEEKSSEKNKSKSTTSDDESDKSDNSSKSASHTTSEISKSKTDETEITFELYFKFITPNAGQTFFDAIDESTETDPLLIFLSSFPHAFQYRQNMPKACTDQLKQAIQAPDLDLAQSLCTIAANEYRDGEHNKEVCLAVMAILNETNYLTQFVRNAFVKVIDDTTDTTDLLRGASQASITSGLILNHFENGFAQKAFDRLKPEKDNLPNAINLLMAMADEFTPPMKFVLSAAFKSSRRKFPEFLVPLNAISSIFMLRYLATELTNLSPVDMGKFSQTLTMTLMFSTKVQQLPDDLYPQLALFLLNLTHLENMDEEKPIDFELTDEAIINKLLTFMFYEANEQKYFYKIILNLIEKMKSPVHPMTYSISEMLENLFTGTDEAFETAIEGKTFSPSKYTRKQAAQD